MSYLCAKHPTQIGKKETLPLVCVCQEQAWSQTSAFNTRDYMRWASRIIELYNEQAQLNARMDEEELDMRKYDKSHQTYVHNSKDWI